MADLFTKHLRRWRSKLSAALVGPPSEQGCALRQHGHRAVLHHQQHTLCQHSKLEWGVATVTEALSGPCSALGMAANPALPSEVYALRGSGRACQGQQECCFNTPNQNTVLNTASESLSCNLGTGTLAELCNDCATHGL